MSAPISLRCPGCGATLAEDEIFTACPSCPARGRANNLVPVYEPCDPADVRQSVPDDA
jgi:hypothetical protein